MKGAIAAKGKKMIFMNVPNDKLDQVVSTLPAMLAPTISRLSRSDMWEIITVLDEVQLPEVIGKVRAAGAMDIVVVDIEKVVR